MIRHQHNQDDMGRLWWWDGRYALLRHRVLPNPNGFFGGFHAQAVDGEHYLFACQHALIYWLEECPPRRDRWPIVSMANRNSTRQCQLLPHMFRVVTDLDDEVFIAYPDRTAKMPLQRAERWDDYVPYGEGMLRVPGHMQQVEWIADTCPMIYGEYDSRVAADGRLYPSSKVRRQRGQPPRVFDATHRYHVAVQPDGRQIRVAQNGPATFVLGVNYLDGVTSVAISPDQERLLATAPDGVTVFSLPGLVKQAEYALPGNHTSLWAPDGLTFAVADKYTVTVMDA